MKILLVHRYYWPDTPPYASILRSIAEHLAQTGHEVAVLTAQPSYGSTANHEASPATENLNGVSITRLPLLKESKDRPLRRIANLFLFAAQIFGRIVTDRNHEIVMAATTPPVLVALAARVASRASGAQFIYHMQDIYPEVLGANSGNPLNLPLRALRAVDSTTTKRADRVVVLSADMQECLKSRGHAVEHVRVINNFIPDSSHSAAATTSKPIELPQSYRVIFAGNLGYFQGLEHVVDAFHILAERNVEAHLAMFGDGTARADLVERAGAMVGSRVFFPGRVSQAEAEQHIANSDLALVTLNPRVIETAFPSKTMTYLAIGTPVLAAVERTSELARFLEENQAGTSCDLTAEALADTIQTYIGTETPDRGHIRSLAASYATPSARLPQWTSLMEELR